MEWYLVKYRDNFTYKMNARCNQVSENIKYPLIKTLLTSAHHR